MPTSPLPPVCCRHSLLCATPRKAGPAFWLIFWLLWFTCSNFWWRVTLHLAESEGAQKSHLPQPDAEELTDSSWALLERCLCWLLNDFLLFCLKCLSKTPTEIWNGVLGHLTEWLILRIACVYLWDLPSPSMSCRDTKPLCALNRDGSPCSAVAETPACVRQHFASTVEGVEC